MIVFGELAPPEAPASMLEKQIGAVTFSMSFDALSEMLLVSTSFVSGSERGSG